IINVLADGRAGINLPDTLRNRYAGDHVFRAILAKPKEFRNFEVNNGLIFLRLEEQRLLCVPQLLVNGRHIRELIIDEAHSLLAHLGYRKTLAYLRTQVWWKS
ncbi:hypothetical protein BDZ89DRAFT_899167, partial [Hymenopellis radicata]